jgi:L-2-hydroxyglutarate oxidase
MPSAYTLCRSSYDFVIVGAGVVGLQIASVLRQRVPTSHTILVVDKEASIGCHASGRNSGVLHAGFYYSSESLKARLTVQGNAWMREYMTANALPLNACGKLVVARDEKELVGLDLLLQRGAANGVQVEEVSSVVASRLEPLAKTHKRALWSPSTAVGAPLPFLETLLRDVVASGVDVRLGSPLVSLSRRSVSSGGGFSVKLGGRAADSLTAGHVINAAGLYADKIAHSLGHALHLKTLPFLGLYRYTAEGTLPLKRLIYPVPDLERPFLGVHFTVTSDAASPRVKIGPTAIPAFWREAYYPSADPAAAVQTKQQPSSSASPSPLTPPPPSPPPPPPSSSFWGTFSASEAIEILQLQASLFAHNPSFRALALEEMKKYSPAFMERGAASLLAMECADFKTSEGGVGRQLSFSHFGRPGMRAQLVDTNKNTLVMDFLVERQENVTHILNAVSPGWTCSRPFAELVVDGIMQ